MLQLEWTSRTLCYVKEVGHKRSQIIWFHLYEMSRIGKFIETECRLMVARSWRVVRTGSNYLRTGVSFGGDKNVLKLNRVGGCKTLWMYFSVMWISSPLKNELLPFFSLYTKIQVIDHRPPYKNETYQGIGRKLRGISLWLEDEQSFLEGSWKSTEKRKINLTYTKLRSFLINSP